MQSGAVWIQRLRLSAADDLLDRPRGMLGDQWFRIVFRAFEERQIVFRSRRFPERRKRCEGNRGA